MKASPDLNKLLQLLAKNEIDFVVIGGFAGVLYGSTVVTRALDICMIMKPEQLDKLRKVLSPFNPVHRRGAEKLSFLKHPESLNGIQNLYLDTDLGTLDVLGEITGVGAFSEVRQNASNVTVFGLSVKIISMEDLINSKIALGQPKDLVVVAELEKIQQKLKE